MGRPKAYTDSHFMVAIPTRKSEALTEKEIIELVGCSRAKANSWLNDKIALGIVELGQPSNTGARTYYRTSARPEMWLPSFLNNNDGKIYNLKEWLDAALAKDTLTDKNKIVLLSVLRLWQGALNDDEKFSEVNQEVRVALQKERAILASRLKMFDSFLQDPFLSGDAEMVSMAEGGMRGAKENITAEQVNDKYNALRELA